MVFLARNVLKRVSVAVGYRQNLYKIKNHQIFLIEFSPNQHQILITKAVVCILRIYTDSNLSHFLSILRFVLFLVHKYFKFSSFLWPTMTSFDNLSFLGTWTVFSMKLWFEAQNFSSNSIQMFPEIKVFQSKIGDHWSYQNKIPTIFKFNRCGGYYPETMAK